MIILVTLNPGLGIGLGPTFEITNDTGVFSQTVTLAELLDGIYLVIPDGSVYIIITSVDTCYNSAILMLLHINSPSSSISSSASSSISSSSSASISSSMSQSVSSSVSRSRSSSISSSASNSISSSASSSVSSSVSPSIPDCDFDAIVETTI